jgi:hypothetical protein
MQIPIALLVLVLTGCLPSRTPVLAPSEAHADPSLTNLVARIDANNPRLVRLSSSETGRLEGDRVSLLGDSVFLNTDAGMRAIATVNVDSVWIQSTAARIVGIIAAVPCALFGASVGGFIGSDPDGNPTPLRGILFPVIGMVGGGAVCGLIGAGIGSLIPRWQLEYPRPSDDAI